MSQDRDRTELPVCLSFPSHLKVRLCQTPPELSSVHPFHRSSHHIEPHSYHTIRDKIVLMDALI
jgi:hypothetical protein